jgi:hypothetical protein
MEHRSNYLKDLCTFAGYKRISENIRMTADKILDLYLSEALKRRHKSPNWKQTYFRKSLDKSLSEYDDYYKFIYYYPKKRFFKKIINLKI